MADTKHDYRVKVFFQKDWIFCSKELKKNHFSTRKIGKR